MQRLRVAILDDYQAVTSHLACFGRLAGHEVKVFEHPARGLGQLAARLADFDALVLIRERTRIDAALPSCPGCGSSARPARSARISIWTPAPGVAWWSQSRAAIRRQLRSSLGY